MTKDRTAEEQAAAAEIEAKKTVFLTKEQRAAREKEFLAKLEAQRNSGQVKAKPYEQYSK